MTDYAAVSFATEVAFANLIRVASAKGVKLDPVMGLMYLPSQAVTRQFQEACRAVVDGLRSTEPETALPVESKP